jgi:hypothetical protein
MALVRQDGLFVIPIRSFAVDNVIQTLRDDPALAACCTS